MFGRETSHHIAISSHVHTPSKSTFPIPSRFHSMHAMILHRKLDGVAVVVGLVVVVVVVVVVLVVVDS
jgi:lipopolysaccharide/colanic/teichoic acid biosynthesis glycosyltransferase